MFTGAILAATAIQHRAVTLLAGRDLLMKKLRSSGAKSDGKGLKLEAFTITPNVRVETCLGASRVDSQQWVDGYDEYATKVRGNPLGLAAVSLES